MVAEPHRGQTAAEIAARHNRTTRSVHNWLAEPGAPSPIGRRETGRRPAGEYDPDQVDAFLRAAGHLPPLPPQPAEDTTMTLEEAATYCDVAYSTARAYVARSQWPPADLPADGEHPPRWRRSTIDRVRAARKRLR